MVERGLIGVFTTMTVIATVCIAASADLVYAQGTQTFYGAFGQPSGTSFNGGYGNYNAPQYIPPVRLGQGSAGGYNAYGGRLNGGYQVDGTPTTGYGNYPANNGNASYPASAGANFYGSATGFYGNSTGYPNNLMGYGNGYSSYAGGYNGYNWYGVKNGSYRGYGVGDASYVNQINGYNGYDWYGNRNGNYSGFGGGSYDMGAAAWQPGNYYTTNQPNPAIMRDIPGSRF